RGGARDGAGVQREVVEQRGERLLDGEADGGGIHLRDLLDRTVVEGREREGPGFRVRMLRIQEAGVGELDTLRLERRAVVELDALAQRERVGEAVGRHLPGGGQARLLGERALLE